MKYRVPEEIEKHRITKGPLATSKIHGFNGAFELPGIIDGFGLIAIVSDNHGWDHISVTTRPDNRCPTWAEMCYVKDLFFGKNQWAIQFHPPQNQNVNIHENCLHLWRPNSTPFPSPPTRLVY